MNNSIKFANESDEALVQLALSNSNNFIYLIKRYESRLLRYILRLSNFSHDEAEDVLQEVFIKVYQNLNDFDPRLKFSSWIYRITHNQVISTFRKNKIRPLLTDTEGGIINNLVADLDINKEVDQQFLKQKIADILHEMDYKYAQVLVLKFYEDKSYQEISDILQKSEGTIASLINRAKKKFIKELENANK
jgi:RNA polymerase sigma-70 factor (ECF subfamily)